LSPDSAKISKNDPTELSSVKSWQGEHSGQEYHFEDRKAERYQVVSSYRLQPKSAKSAFFLRESVLHMTTPVQFKVFEAPDPLQRKVFETKILEFLGQAFGGASRGL
jgi:hypothetical protein